MTTPSPVVDLDPAALEQLAAELAAALAAWWRAEVSQQHTVTEVGTAAKVER